jgi:hypothetical protein
MAQTPAKNPGPAGQSGGPRSPVVGAGRAHFEDLRWPSDQPCSGTVAVVHFDDSDTLNSPRRGRAIRGRTAALRSAKGKGGARDFGRVGLME